jgi:RNA polymerase sigma-70 factor (ECF subfamily)
MTRQEIDLQLIEKAKNGNQNAYFKIFKHYHNAINYYIWNMVKNNEDAEDLTMITFEKAFLKLNKYTPTALFSTWLNKIAKYSVLDYIKYRRITKYTFFDIDEFPSLISYTINNPEDELIYKELFEQTEIALAELPSHLREVINMRYEEDLLLREIAEKQNVNISVIGGQIRYARQYLYRSLTDKQVL